MVFEKGNMSVHTQNIFPVIKKWLYSDKDIFLRELVSNGVDAIQKLKRLALLGEAKLSDDYTFKVEVILDKDAKTIKICDNGLGMSADEVKTYINQVAFSGAEEFLNKYSNTADEGATIIGHFGLGFYSAFMVSDKVELETLSYAEGSKGVKWTCSGGVEYEMQDSDKDSIGTTITLHIAEDSVDFLEYFKLNEILKKYCYFLPVDIFLIDTKVPDKSEKDETDSLQTSTEPINEKQPLWLKRAGDATNEEYKEFYSKVFHDYNEPLFWIHLNVDYPFNLKGILYFPKIRNEFGSMEGQVKLYCNQVFVADNIKEVIPEFLLLLKGTIDCPDLPLNVSRSFLQNDGYVKKISNHISKKVSDKLLEIFKDKREEFHSYWDDLNPFIKYGCLRDEKFYDRVKDIIVYKTIDGEFLTLSEYKEKHGEKIFYVGDEKQQAQYINTFKNNGLAAVVLQTIIDKHFIQFIEFKDGKVKFARIDSDIADQIRQSTEVELPETAWLQEVFQTVAKNDKLQIKFDRLKTAELPALILISEQARRMHEFAQQYGMKGDDSPFDDGKSLVVNLENDLVKTLLLMKDIEDKKSDVNDICEVIYALAVLGHDRLDPERMTSFLLKNSAMLSRIISL